MLQAVEHEKVAQFVAVAPAASLEVSMWRPEARRPQAPRLYRRASTLAFLNDSEDDCLAAVLQAVQHEKVAQFVAVVPARFHGSQHATAFLVIHGSIQTGSNVILLIHREGKGKDDAISFSTGHVIYPFPGSRRLNVKAAKKVSGDPSPLEEDRHPTCGIAD